MGDRLVIACSAGRRGDATIAAMEWMRFSWGKKQKFPDGSDHLGATAVVWAGAHERDLGDFSRSTKRLSLRR